VNGDDVAWLEQRVILAIHDEQISAHGGSPGIRDPALLESALGRPRQHAAYAEPEIAELAALYALGIVRNHPFIDGNKRTGFVAFELFLAKNGHRCDATDADATQTFWNVAAGDIDDAAFFAWARRHAVPAG
jgi:death-on-curing protein